MKYLFLSLILTSCASVPKGGLTWSIPFKEKPICPEGREIIYQEVTVNTTWETGKQEVEYSWQCTKNGTTGDTYRVSKKLGETEDEKN